MRWSTVLALCLVFTGCSREGDGRSVEPGRANQLVVQQADAVGYRMRSSSGDSQRWAATYARSGAAIESTVEISDSVDDAKGRLAEAREALRAGSAQWQPIGEPGLGDESFAATAVAGAVRSYRVVWREDNVAAVIRLHAPEGTLRFADALALAEQQDRHIVAAAS